MKCIQVKKIMKIKANNHKLKYFKVFRKLILSMLIKQAMKTFLFNQSLDQELKILKLKKVWKIFQSLQSKELIKV
jgi:hypothetical protein